MAARAHLLLIGQQPWDNELTLEYLDLYKNEEVIWDPSHPQHKDKFAVMDAWERIRQGMSVDCTVEDLKKKKESVMTTYRIHVRKRKKFPNYRCIWFAYDKLDSFLGHIYNADSKVQDYSDHEYSSNTIKTENISPVSVQKIKRNTGHNSPYFVNYTSKKEASYSQPVRPVYQTQTAQTKELDECDLYAKLLARKLRRLDEEQRDEAMHEIDNIMYQVIMNKSVSKQSGVRIQPKAKSPVFIVSEQDDEQFEEEHLDYDAIEDPIDD